MHIVFFKIKTRLSLATSAAKRFNISSRLWLLVITMIHLVESRCIYDWLWGLSQIWLICFTSTGLPSIFWFWERVFAEVVCFKVLEILHDNRCCGCTLSTCTLISPKIIVINSVECLFCTLALVSGKDNEIGRSSLPIIELRDLISSDLTRAGEGEGRDGWSGNNNNGRSLVTP